MSNHWQPVCKPARKPKCERRERDDDPCKRRLKKHHRKGKRG